METFTSGKHHNQGRGNNFLSETKRQVIRGTAAVIRGTRSINAINSAINQGYRIKDKMTGRRSRDIDLGA